MNKCTNRVSFRTVGEESEAEGRVLQGKNFGLRPQIPRYALNDTQFGRAHVFLRRFQWHMQKQDYYITKATPQSAQSPA